MTLTSGFTRMLLADFDAFNAQAMERILIAAPETTYTTYTNFAPDTDPLYVWARQEPIFTNLMTEAEKSAMVSLEDAISQGKRIDEGGE